MQRTYLLSVPNRKLFTAMLKHILNVLRSLFHEFAKSHTRSIHWSTVEKHHLKSQPYCQACGSVVRLQVHHISPFHLHPEMELQDSNLITLCMDSNECHLLIGHLDNFKNSNCNVVNDSATFLKSTDVERTTIIENIKKNRKF